MLQIKILKILIKLFVQFEENNYLKDFYFFEIVDSLTIHIFM